MQSGHWPLYRYNPDLAEAGQEPAAARLQGAQRAARQVHLQRDALHHAVQSQPEAAKRLLALAQADVAKRWKLYEYLAPAGQCGNVRMQAGPRPGGEK